MLLHFKHCAAATVLMIGAGAYPIVVTAQTQTQADEIQVQASEAEERAGNFGETAGSALSDIGEAIGEAAEGTAEVIEQTVQQTGEAIDAQINASDDLDDAQKHELEQAAAEGKPIPNPELIIGIQKEDQWLSSELVGREARNPQGEIIGPIGAILFSDKGPVGVVLEVGGLGGMDARNVAIKWAALTIQKTRSWSKPRRKNSRTRRSSTRLRSSERRLSLRSRGTGGGGP